MNLVLFIESSFRSEEHHKWKIPAFDGSIIGKHVTRPYEQIPFQFSCHHEKADGAIEHVEFLSIDGEDPRRACAERLVVSLGSGENAHGSIITYNASFERRCIQGLAAACSDLADELAAINDRIVDLLPIVRNHYYHRDQLGSWLIKAVLPTICPDLDYGALEVKAGDDAQAAYMEAIECQDVARKAAIQDSLLAYCKLDTLAMVRVLAALQTSND